jgi:hypothetical protein
LLPGCARKIERRGLWRPDAYRSSPHKPRPQVKNERPVVQTLLLPNKTDSLESGHRHALRRRAAVLAPGRRERGSDDHRASQAGHVPAIPGRSMEGKKKGEAPSEKRWRATHHSTLRAGVHDLSPSQLPLGHGFVLVQLLSVSGEEAGCGAPLGRDSRLASSGCFVVRRSGRRGKSLGEQRRRAGSFFERQGGVAIRCLFRPSKGGGRGALCQS